ncbi:nucleoside hydrolase [Shouchella clausii]|uniref:nucleoside hydrolase n=1 Tax=Shouchella clausii TaxID=79880 RepID=UPI000B962277|nr:nucleoside hydrolase [Shouchella clausii]AST96592.1 nucleoside hydrolase [Shouchella clausii]MCR1288314.1 nucleoside hydrolase [Shouchella clausii]MDO7266184.1 nucleoside hydrolase [Shouchella clausii]MDO7286901.1 nucleoside hydrolase [Shouchella clausii]MEB5471193.1 nucleoside hydrolase [Shouchella clausii]
MARKILLDVDTGVDDALAIILASKSTAAQLLAITTVNGNVSLEKATVNTLKVLTLLHKEGDIPVIQGAHAPLRRPCFFEHSVHGNDGLGGALPHFEPTAQPADGYAPDYIIEQANRYPGELTLVMTGPLTNLALALEKCPDLPKLVAGVVYMGGAAFTHGNVTPVAEYNMYVDPEAARKVIHAGFAPLVQVGLDVTRKALLTRENIGSLVDSPVKQFIKTCTADYIKRYEARNNVAACALHDPLAVAYALKPELLHLEEMFVEVETNSQFCDGQTVCDRQQRLGKPANVNVATEIDSDAFLSYFLHSIQN